VGMRVRNRRCRSHSGHFSLRRTSGKPIFADVEPIKGVKEKAPAPPQPTSRIGIASDVTNHFPAFPEFFSILSRIGKFGSSTWAAAINSWAFATNSGLADARSCDSATSLLRS